MRIILASLALLSFSITLSAQTVYKFVDKNGNVVFSDTPVDGAERVDVPPTSIIKMAPVTLPQTEVKPAVIAGYDHVSITTPSQDAVFSNESGPIMITGSSSPELRADHRYRFSINGQPTPPSQQAYYTLSSEARGSYTATLEIVDNNLHVVVTSAPVTFHVRRHSKLFTKPATPAPK